MTLPTQSWSLQPPAEAATRNISPDSVVASYDLLCLPGMVLSFLDDATATYSSGVHDSARHLCAVDQGEPLPDICTSCGTTDSSLFAEGLAFRAADPGGCATLVKVADRDAAAMDLEALLLMLENLMIFVMLPDGDSPAETSEALGSEAE